VSCLRPVHVASPALAYPGSCTTSSRRINPNRDSVWNLGCGDGEIDRLTRPTTEPEYTHMDVVIRLATHIRVIAFAGDRLHSRRNPAAASTVENSSGARVTPHDAAQDRIGLRRSGVSHQSEYVVDDLPTNEN
jgi:hypothetical protein